MFTPEMILAILPEISLLVLVGVILVVDLSISKERKGILAWLTVGGLALTFVLTFLLSRPGDETELWGGMIRHDWLAYIFNLVFLFGAGITALFAIGWEQVGKRGEFYILLLTSTLGMSLMSAAGDLIMLFLAIETASIPLYVLAGFMTKDEKSPEAGFKYLLFGAMTTAVMLYGFTLLYGFSGGETNIYELAANIQAGELPVLVSLGTLLLVLVGFGFKVSMVPFHFWAPDVYEGAPTPVAGFLSTASKAAGFAVMIRFLLVIFPAANIPQWVIVIGVISVLSMALGNTLALAQKNIKRLLAYSSIAHAGYVLMGVAAAAHTSLGVTSVVYYLIVYLVTSLAAFGVVAIVWHTTGSDDVSAYDGLSRRSPMLAVAMLVAFLSLAGVPPFGGFIAKVLVIASAVDADLIWLAVLGVLNAIIGLYYYLIVLKHVYLFRSDEDETPIKVARPHAVALTICIISIIILGVVLAPWFEWTSFAADAIF
ncbi:MAG: NADH-quinone oxidoreductase subunit N [Chloroflexi bacterium]|nr:NADH-quinone oxidoreductase subunit N [Chloroflexota bacterium]